MKKIIVIEPDGWVHLNYEPDKDGLVAEGLGDIGVDVEIIDLRNEKNKV